MTRGRTRKPDPTLPAHIEAGLLPRGIYWRANKSGTGGVWRCKKDGALEIVATETALLSELHAIMESDTTPDGSVDRVLDRFHASTEFKDLAAGTQRNYKAYSKFICSYKTKMGVPFGLLQVDRLNIQIIQRLHEVIAHETPTKANHLLRYLRRTFAWGVRLGYCKTNPASGVKQIKERPKNSMPASEAQQLVLEFARQRGQRKAHTKSSVAPYLWPAMVIAYACRLRGIEVTTLTDADAGETGILCRRRKGSLPTLVTWNTALREAWEALAELRRTAMAANRLPVAMVPERRILMVSMDGHPITKSGFDSAWQRMIKLAIAEGVITPEQRFSLHGLKHRGITDTKGTRADRKEAGGHKSESAAGVYNHAVSVVEPAESG